MSLFQSKCTMNDLEKRGKDDSLFTTISSSSIIKSYHFSVACNLSEIVIQVGITPVVETAIFFCKMNFEDNDGSVSLKSKMILYSLLVKMFGRQIFFLVIAMLVRDSLGQRAELIDFTYSHVRPDIEGSVAQQGRLGILPSFKSANQLEFPLICQLKDRLDEDKASEQWTREETSHSNLEYLKGRIMKLLKLTEDIKDHRSRLLQIDTEYNLKARKANGTDMASDLEQFRDKQKSLAQQQEKINHMTTKLNSLLSMYNESPQEQQIQQISLQYSLAFTENKISHYEKLKRDLLKQEGGKKPFNYEIYFDNIDSSFQTMNKQLDEIDDMAGNYAYRMELSQKIVNLKNKIKIGKLTLEEKISCNQTKENLCSRVHTEQIRKVFHQLRVKREESKGINNQNCEGVAIILEEKIRNWLKIINRVYKCSQGLKDTEIAILEKEKEMRRLKEEFDRISDEETQVYQKFETQKRDEFNEEMEIMRTLKADEYRHSIPHIEQLIEQSKKEKEQTEKKLRSLPAYDRSNVTYPDIERLVDEIKREKATYCHEYEVYEEINKKIQSKKQNYEKMEIQLAQFRAQYMQQRKRGIDLEDSYTVLALQILEQLPSREVQ